MEDSSSRITNKEEEDMIIVEVADMTIEGPVTLINPINSKVLEVALGINRIEEVAVVFKVDGHRKV